MGLRLAEGIDLTRLAALGGALDENRTGALEADGLVRRDGNRLAATPQGMVTPEKLTVSVQWPYGYDVDELPEGWTRGGPGLATYEDPALATQPTFSLTGSAAPVPGP